MAFFSVSDVRLAGIAACVPQNEVSNMDYRWIPEKERQLLVKTIGVEKRRMAPKGIATSDLALAAAEKLLKELGWKKEDIKLLIFVSQARDYIIPSTACILQNRLGLLNDCVAFDVDMGCSGYIYGLSIAAGMMQKGAFGKALLLVGDVSTITSSYRDKSAYPLFGDAATATALEFIPGSPEMQFSLHTDGSGYKAIIIPDGGVRRPMTRKSFDYKKIAPGIQRSNLHLALNGIEVFNFSLREVVPNIKGLLKETSKTLDDFDFLVFHQANKLINETIRKMLKTDKAKVPYSIGKYGNTSSASIPVTIVSELREMVTSGKTRLLLSAFGIGLSWGTVFMETDGIVCPEMVEIK